MGFKTQRDLPVRIDRLDFKKLQNFQVRTLADWMGVRRQLDNMASSAERRAFLRDRCLENLERAQKGYETIVLQKDVGVTTTGAVPEAMEKRMYEVLTDVIVKHRETLGETAFRVVGEAAEAMKKTLEVYAKEQVREAAEKRAPVVIKDGSKTRKVKGVLPPEFQRIVELASAGIPIMMVGPAGCGKTFLGQKVAEALDLDYSDQSCSEGMSESVFNGQLLPIGNGGSFQHCPSPFMERYEKGGVFLLDEMDAGDPNLFTYINKAIANESYTVAARYKNPVVKKHDKFRLIAAANTFGNGADAMYVGRNQLDAATLDRFKVGLVTMDYSHDVESSLAPADLCSWAWTVRGKIGEFKLRRIMSTRVIKDLATMTRLYKWEQSDWEASYFKGWTEAERKMILNSMPLKAVGVAA
jgi:hypothetical protein